MNHMKLLIFNDIFFGLKTHMIKSMKLLEENTVEYLHGLEIGKDFLSSTQSPNREN